MQTSDKTHDQWNALHDDEELQRLAMTMSPQTLQYNSPALAAQLAAMRAASAANNVHMAEQLDGSAFGHALDLECKLPVILDPRTNVFPDSYDYATSNYKRIPATQFIKLAAAQYLPASPSAGAGLYQIHGADTPGAHVAQLRPPPSQNLESLQRRPYPRMRPPPPPSPTTILADSQILSVGNRPVTSPAIVDKGKQVAKAAWPPAQVTSPASKVWTNPTYLSSGQPTGPFVGHGMMNQIRFKSSVGGSSGLRIKRSPSPVFNNASTSNAPLLRQAQLKFETQPFGLPGYEVAGSTLAHSGQYSSPINLCSSSDMEDIEDVDDNDYDLENADQFDDDEDTKIPEEVEGLEEAHHRAASSTGSRSSSPIDPRDIIIRGGEPTMDPAAFKELLSTNRHAKLWQMAEKGLAIKDVFGRKVPADRYLKVLAPLNPKRPAKIWKEMQSGIFNNSRKASAIGVAVGKILLVYKDVKYMLDVVGFSYNPQMPEDDVLRAIKLAIDDARESGAPLTTILTPWEYYFWTRDPKDGWYALADAKLGNHPNFQVTGQHRSGRVTPPTQSAPSAKGKEKRQRGDDDLESLQDFTGSPRPKAAVRQRSSTPIIAQATLESAGVVIQASLPTLRARAAAAAAGRPTSQAVMSAGSSSSASAAPASSAAATASPAVKETPTPANVLLESRASAVELQAQLLAFRQAQLELDQQNSNVRNQLITDEQRALEDDRIHCLEMDVERAEREAAELEERVKLERHNQYFDQCLRVASSSGLDPDIVRLANQHVRQALEAGMNIQPMFVSPRAPSTARVAPRRAASVPVQTYASAPPMTPPARKSEASVPAPQPANVTSGLSTATLTSGPVPPSHKSITSSASRQFAAPVSGPARHLSHVTPSTPVSGPPRLISGSGSVGSGSVHAPPSHARTVSGSSSKVVPALPPASPLVTASSAHKALAPIFAFDHSPVLSNAQRIPGPIFHSPARLHLTPDSVAFSPSHPTSGPNPPGAPHHNTVNVSGQFGFQVHEASSRPSTSQLHINVTPHVPAQRHVLSDHMVLEVDETVSPSGEGFVHIDSVSYYQCQGGVDTKEN